MGRKGHGGEEAAGRGLLARPEPRPGALVDEAAHALRLGLRHARGRIVDRKAAERFAPGGAVGAHLVEDGHDGEESKLVRRWPSQVPSAPPAPPFPLGPRAPGRGRRRPCAFDRGGDRRSPSPGRSRRGSPKPKPRSEPARDPRSELSSSTMRRTLAVDSSCFTVDGPALATITASSISVTLRRLGGAGREPK